MSLRVCVCARLANVTSQIRLVRPSCEIKASASIPLRLQPNGTTRLKLAHVVRERDGGGWCYRNDVRWMTSVSSVAFTLQEVENGTSSVPPQPHVAKERQAETFSFFSVCSLLYPLELPWPLHMSIEIVLSFSSFILLCTVATCCPLKVIFFPFLSGVTTKAPLWFWISLS